MRQLVIILFLLSVPFTSFAESDVERSTGNYIAQTGDSADAGYVRLKNAENIAWEASPAGTDVTIGVDASEVVQISSATTVTGNLTSTASVLSTATTTIGWSVVAGADTACSTTCTNACVFGVNTASLVADIVDCADATADECLCAGAS